MGTNIFPSGGATAFGSAFPVFPASPGTAFTGQENSNTVQGFIGDGDYIVLPAQSGSVDYFNSSGVSQVGWPIAPSAIGAGNADLWVAWFMTSTGVLFVEAVDTTTAPDTLYLATIDSGGNVVDLGNDQLSTDFSISEYWVDDNLSSGTSMFRDSDLSGNLFIFSSSAAGTQEVEIDISDGSIVSGPTLKYSFTANNARLHYRTPNGNYCGEFDFNATTSMVLISVAGDSGQHNAYIPISTGVAGSTGTLVPIMWKGEIVMASGNTNRINVGSKTFAKDGFDAAIDATTEVLGVST